MSYCKESASGKDKIIFLSEEDAKKELSFWVSHGVLKESQLQRIQSFGKDIQTETVYMASKTLDRNPEKDLGFLDDSFQKKKQFDKGESSFEDSLLSKI